MSNPLDNFIAAAKEAGHSDEYIAGWRIYFEYLSIRNYPVIFSTVHLAIEMRIPTKILTACIEARNIKYSYFKLKKKSGGFREIMTPERDLKFVQQWILHNILSKYKLSDACCGFRKDFSIITNAKVHERARYILRIDLLKFYDTITENRVCGIFKKMGYLSNLSVDLARLVTAPHRHEYWDKFDDKEKEKLKILYKTRPSILPQGAPTSPMLSNIVATILDKRLAGLANDTHCNYSRYADDLTFSSDSIELLPTFSFIKRIVEEEGFWINENKTMYSKRGVKQYVTGLTITHGVHVSKNYRKEIFQHLYYSKKYGPSAHLKKWTEKRGIDRDFYSFQDWLLGSISFVLSVDRKNGKKMFREFNKIDWAI